MAEHPAPGIATGARRRLVLGLGTAYLVVQALLPIAPTLGRITDDDGRSRQYGWQMFSVSPPPQRWEVVTAAGDSRWFDLDVAYYRREDVTYEPHLSRWLCDHVDGARLVHRHRIPDGIDADDRDAFTLQSTHRCEPAP